VRERVPVNVIRRLGAGRALEMPVAGRADLRHHDPRLGALLNIWGPLRLPVKTERGNATGSSWFHRVERLGLARFADRRVKLSPDYVGLVGNL
jgi:hypothetical protein